MSEPTKPPTCPICNKPLAGDAARVSEFLPFCSERCRLVDFYRWSEGKYAIVEQVGPLRLAEELEQRPTELDDQSDESQ